MLTPESKHCSEFASDRGHRGSIAHSYREGALGLRRDSRVVGMPKTIGLMMQVLPVALVSGLLAGCGAATDSTHDHSPPQTVHAESAQPRRIVLPENARPLDVAKAIPREHGIARVQQTEPAPLVPAQAPRTPSATAHSFASSAPHDFRAPLPSSELPKSSEAFSDGSNSDASNNAMPDSVVPWARPVTRPERLIGAAHQADMKTRQGIALAQRGMRLSARAEFVQALRLLAEAMDEARRCRAHRDALARGLTALDESRQLIREDSRLEGNRTLSEMVAGHRTPVLANANTNQITLTLARERYLDYAQEQLAAAVVGEPVGSMALYGLGRAEAIEVRQTTGADCAAACFQAAISVDRRNFLASNELGVHLARRGQYRAARTQLVASWEQGRQAMTLKNLVVVHRKLGEAQLASQAEQLLLSMKAPRGGANAQQPGIRWTDAATFAATSESASPVTRPSLAVAPTPVSETATTRRETTSWLPWKPKTHR
jgi:hypothetical protein